MSPDTGPQALRHAHPADDISNKCTRWQNTDTNPSEPQQVHKHALLRSVLGTQLLFTSTRKSKVGLMLGSDGANTWGRWEVQTSVGKTCITNKTHEELKTKSTFWNYRFGLKTASMCSVSEPLKRLCPAVPAIWHQSLGDASAEVRDTATCHWYISVLFP